MGFIFGKKKHEDAVERARGISDEGENDEDELLREGGGGRRALIGPG